MVSLEIDRVIITWKSSGLQERKPRRTKKSKKAAYNCPHSNWPRSRAQKQKISKKAGNKISWVEARRD